MNSASPKLAFSLFVLTLLLFHACGNDKTEDAEYVAKIGKAVLTKEDLEESLPPLFPPRARHALEDEMIQQWAHRELLFIEAVNRGLTHDAGLEKQVDNYRKSLYGKAFLDVYLSNKIFVSTEEVREHYKNNREAYRRQLPEAQVIQFVLDSNDEAVDVKRGLLSYDGETRQNLHASYRVEAKTVTMGDLLPELDREIFGDRTSRGVLGPIRSSFGYHVLEVLQFYPSGSYRGLDEVYDRISQEVFRTKSHLAYVSLIDSLKSVHLLQINRDHTDHE